MAVLQDRVPQKPGRVLITPEDPEQPPFYATVSLADDPITPGEVVNRQNVIDTIDQVYADKIVMGSYVGNDTDDRWISMPATPKAVLVHCTLYQPVGSTYSQFSQCDAFDGRYQLVMAGHPTQNAVNFGGAIWAKIATSKLIVNKGQLNESGKTYVYIAFF